jgi:hypothetical protein
MYKLFTMISQYKIAAHACQRKMLDNSSPQKKRQDTGGRVLPQQKQLQGSRF